MDLETGIWVQDVFSGETSKRQGGAGQGRGGSHTRVWLQTQSHRGETQPNSAGGPLVLTQGRRAPSGEWVEERMGLYTEDSQECAGFLFTGLSEASSLKVIL